MMAIGVALVLASVLVAVTAGWSEPTLEPTGGVPPTTDQGASHFGTSTGSSTNWGGYVVNTPNNAVSDVKGSWVVPKFKGSCGGLYNFSEAAFWVGIDGYSSGTVEQVGTSVECLSALYVSVVTYFAWYEFYPAGPVVLGLSIAPGDHVSGEVRYTSSTSLYTVSLRDATTGGIFSKSVGSISANRSSAEWIAEAPTGVSGILPLVDFGTVHFTGCAATISGVAHTVGGFSNIQLWMVNAAGTGYKASPGSLGTSAAGFAVVWKSYGP